MDAYTYVAKPTSSAYSLQTFEGRQIYDDITLSYDKSTALYDSINTSAYTKVAKPADGNARTLTPGMTIGLLMPLTYATTTIVSSDVYTHIPKPTS